MVRSVSVRPGVWEVRVALGADRVTGICRQRSVTVHGNRADAEWARASWAKAAALLRASGRSDSTITTGRLLELWAQADHRWRPSTVSGYRSLITALRADPLALRRASALTPALVRAVCAGWLAAGVGEPTVWARVRALRSALSWATVEGILERHPLGAMPGPPQPAVRLHVPSAAVRALLRHAEAAVTAHRDAGDASHRGKVDRHRAEQVGLLTQLAADSGARRGELAALQLGDLDGTVLTISRAASNEVIGATKSGRARRVTLGATSVELWRDTVASWDLRSAPGPFGPWLFSADPDHASRLRTSTLGVWFAGLCRSAGMAEVTLHRLRHSVATALVGRGEILQAQNRLGHADAYTTLRTYAHVLPLHDREVADLLDQLYRT